MSAIKEGDFKSLKLDEGEVEMLEDAYQAVSKANRWGFLKREDVPGSQGFMFSDLPELRDIDTYMEYGGHSGSSYGWTMRNMEYIAKNGWTAYVFLKGVNPRPPPPAQVPAQAPIQPPVQSEFPSQNLVAVMNFIESNPNIDDLSEFADAIQKNQGMRSVIPDIDNQAAALRKFAAGGMSYAEMRSLCG
jgi:hypothetical protein